MVQVKICGITNLEDARSAVEAGADLLGFIFYPRSPRYVEPAQVRAILEALKDERAEERKSAAVGVFVDEPAARVAEILARSGVDYAQLHGDEPPAVLAALAPQAFKALRPSSAAEAQIEAEWYGEFGPPAGPQLLLDAYDPDSYGGTGKQADWHTAAGLARLYPRLLLAGGLTPQNVAGAVRTVRPWGVDVSSGVEHRPGEKDHDAVRRFVAAAKGALA